MQCSYDRWIRTTEPVHFRASQELFRRAQAAGDIYKGSYSGYYCPNCNTFYSAEELTPQGTCPNHPTTTPDWLEEENYFFALSRYTERLLQHVEAHPDFIVPATWRGEILNVLRSGLRDFSVSRPVRNQKLVEGRPWGVPVPGDPEHVIYVWFDALTNYLTAAGFPDEPERFERTWPADAHVIGKDITRFHCLYWPAMLLSAGLPLPRSVAVHGFMTLDGQRISKTTGNIVDPVEVVQQFGADALRFYLMRDISFERDGDFTQANLIQRYNSDLANDLGNLLNRTVSMIGRYFEGVVPEPPAEGRTGIERDAELRRVAEEAGALTAAGIERWDFDGALDGTWALVRRANQYIDENEPWKLARDPQQRGRLGGVLYGAAEFIAAAGAVPGPRDPHGGGADTGAAGAAGPGAGGLAPRAGGGAVGGPAPGDAGAAGAADLPPHRSRE